MTEVGHSAGFSLQIPAATPSGLIHQTPATATANGPLQPVTEVPPGMHPLNRLPQNPWNQNAPSFASILQGKQSNPQTSPRTTKKSFTSVFSKEAEVQVIQPTIHRGKLAIMFSDEDITKLASHYTFAMVGKFSRKSPEFKAIKPGLAKMGFRGDFTVGALRPGYVLLNFQLEEDYTRLWLKPEWQIAGWPMRVFKWSPAFTYEAESTLAAVWVAFPDLPVHFFNKSSLYSIASLVGKPLKLDEPTADRTRPSVARVCVEIDLLKSYDQELWVGCGSQGGFPLNFYFENRPPYCQLCCKRGHDAAQCLHGQQREGKVKEVRQPEKDNSEKIIEKINKREKEAAVMVRQQEQVLQKNGYPLRIEQSGAKQKEADIFNQRKEKNQKLAAVPEHPLAENGNRGAEKVTEDFEEGEKEVSYETSSDKRLLISKKSRLTQLEPQSLSKTRFLEAEKAHLTGKKASAETQLHQSNLTASSSKIQPLTPSAILNPQPPSEPQNKDDPKEDDLLVISNNFSLLESTEEIPDRILDNSNLHSAAETEGVSEGILGTSFQPASFLDKGNSTPKSLTQKHKQKKVKKGIKENIADKKKKVVVQTQQVPVAAEQNYFDLNQINFDLSQNNLEQGQNNLVNGQFNFDQAQKSTANQLLLTVRSLDVSTPETTKETPTEGEDISGTLIKSRKKDGMIHQGQGEISISREGKKVLCPLNFTDSKENGLIEQGIQSVPSPSSMEAEGNIEEPQHFLHSVNSVPTDPTKGRISLSQTKDSEIPRLTVPSNTENQHIPSTSLPTPDEHSESNASPTIDSQRKETSSSSTQGGQAIKTRAMAAKGKKGAALLKMIHPFQHRNANKASSESSKRR